MLRIEKIKLKNLRNDTHFQFHTEFRDLVIKHGAAALKVKPQFDAYLPLYEREDTALKKIVKSEFTAQIKEADKARDSVYIGMVATNTAALRHVSEDVRKSAAKLKIVFDTYGKVTRKSLIDETSIIYNILQDLHGKYEPDVATVCLGQWVAELEARNLAFEALVKERFEETATRTHIVLKDARTEDDAQYIVICDRIDASILIEGEASYEPFVRELNAVIEKFNATSHHHHHHAHHDAPDV